MDFKELAEKIKLPYLEQRMGYHLTNNPNELMKGGVKYVTIHQTGNPSQGANAEAHHAYLRNSSAGRPASWHWTVDEKQAIQSFRDSRVLWHSADTVGNAESIGIELCIDADKAGEAIMGKTNYVQTVENGAKLAAVKLTEYGLGLDKLKQHFDWSGKNCPEQLRAGLHGVTWAAFVARVKFYMDALKPAPIPAARAQAPDGKLWRVAVESFKYRDSADELAARLKTSGFKSFVVLTDDPNYTGGK